MGTALAVLTYLSPWIIELGGWTGSRLDPLARLRGWSEGAATIGEALERVPRPEETFVVVLGHRYNASAMAHYLPQRPRVFRYQPEGRIESQYEVWPDPGEAGLVGQDAIIINTSPEKLPYAALRDAFASFDREPLRRAAIDLGNGHVRTFNAYLARDLQEWPRPRRDPVGL